MIPVLQETSGAEAELDPDKSWPVLTRQDTKTLVRRPIYNCLSWS